MNPIAKNTLAVVAGIFIGGVVNMALVNIGPMIVPLPEGVDVTTPEGLKEGMQHFRPINFLFPFLAHALGTLVGAFIAARNAASHPMKLALGIGAFFLIGGIMMVKMAGGPLWFIVGDLGLAYLPMGYLGGFLAAKKKSDA